MYNFREITEADNAVVAALVRDNLRQFNLDIPGIELKVWNISMQ